MIMTFVVQPIFTHGVIPAGNVSFMFQNLTGNSLSCRYMQCCSTLQYTQALLPFCCNKRYYWPWAICIFETQTHADAEHKLLE